MALFCPSFVSLPIPRLYSIPQILIAQSLTPNTILHNRLPVSVYAHMKHCSTLQSFRCCANSAYSVDGEKSLSTRIIIKGLSPSTSEGFLNRAFSQFGKVSKVKIIVDRKSRQSLGFAYVWFMTEESAQLAAKEIDGKFLDGRFVIAMIAKPESPSSQLKFTPYKF